MGSIMQVQGPPNRWETVTAPAPVLARRAAARGPPAGALRRSSARLSRGLRAMCHRTSLGTDKTHCRTGTPRGKTPVHQPQGAVRHATAPAGRTQVPLLLGKHQQSLVPHAAQRTRANPLRRSPQSRNLRNALSMRRGTPRPSGSRSLARRPEKLFERPPDYGSKDRFRGDRAGSLYAAGTGRGFGRNANGEHGPPFQSRCRAVRASRRAIRVDRAARGPFGRGQGMRSES
jgi:hypothetical protein